MYASGYLYNQLVVLVWLLLAFCSVSEFFSVIVYNFIYLLMLQNEYWCVACVWCLVLLLPS